MFGMKTIRFYFSSSNHFSSSYSRLAGSRTFSSFRIQSIESAFITKKPFLSTKNDGQNAKLISPLFQQTSILFMPQPAMWVLTFSRGMAGGARKIYISHKRRRAMNKFFKDYYKAEEDKSTCMFFLSFYIFSSF